MTPLTNPFYRTINDLGEEINPAEETYLKLLKKYCLSACIALDAVRETIKRNVEKGLLPNYSLGLMSMSNQYNTIGIIGLYEALEDFGYIVKDELGNISYTEKGMDFAKRILAAINDYKEEFKHTYG